jgi:hypothetical protein
MSLADAALLRQALDAASADVAPTREIKRPR